jgi:membrane protein DedA with SNARE-associated domain
LINDLEAIILSSTQTVYDAWGWFGVVVLLIFENSTGITPSEIILGLAGWMLIAEHQLRASMIPIGGFYAAIGSMIGASITYWVARMGGRPLVDRFAHWVRIKPSQISQVEQLFQRWGPGLVLVGRVVPGIRTLINIPAGLARMNFPKFLMATFLGAYIWCTLLIGAGYLLGLEWPLISSYVKQAFPYLLAIGVLTMIAYLILTRRSRISRLQKPQEADSLSLQNEDNIFPG